MGDFDPNHEVFGITELTIAELPRHPLPEILVLSLEVKSEVNESYDSLMYEISHSAKVTTARTIHDTLRLLLSSHNYQAILVTDSVIMDSVLETVEVAFRLDNYVQGGGLVIFGLFSAVSSSDRAFNIFFKEHFGIGWRRGYYFLSNSAFNVNVCDLPVGVDQPQFPESLQANVLHVKNARPNEKIFIPYARQDRLPASGLWDANLDAQQAAVVGAKVGAGYVVYCGIVCGDPEGLNKIIRALCRLEHLEL